jgi:CheY-like chemotaxis protein
MLNGARVLVVEDEWLVRQLVCESLEAAGFDVTEMDDAETALAAMTIAPAVLVTDLNLGPGMDGLALAAEARQRWPALPVVYVTGDYDRFRQRMLTEGERLVPKPFDPTTLVAAVLEMALHQPSAAA